MTRDVPSRRIQEHFCLLRTARADGREEPLSPPEDAISRSRRRDEPVYQADLDHRGDRHRSEPSRINRDRLGDRDGSARKRGGWMGFDCVHHVLPERRSATEPRDHRRVRRESVHGVEAQASVHHQ